MLIGAPRIIVGARRALYNRAAILDRSRGKSQSEIRGVFHNALAHTTLVVLARCVRVAACQLPRSRFFKGLDDDERFERVDVNELLDTLVAEYAEIGATVGLAGKALDAVQAKPRALKRCLRNLVDNALKFGQRDVVQAHGGSLTLRNRPEGGLIAELRLPRRR